MELIPWTIIIISLFNVGTSDRSLLSADREIIQIRLDMMLEEQLIDLAKAYITEHFPEWVPKLERPAVVFEQEENWWWHRRRERRMRKLEIILKKI